MTKVEFYQAFSNTLRNTNFIFDGSEYSSVDDCVSKRKICSRLWHPTSIPYVHQIKLDVYGFIVRYDEDNKVSAIIFANDEQLCLFKMLLFIKYFEQIFIEVESRIMSDYYDTYCLCCKLVKNVKFNTEVVQCVDYKPTFENKNCLVAYGVNTKYQDMTKIENIINKYEVVNVVVNSEDEITTGILRLMSKNNKTRFNIYSKLSEDSIVLDRFKQQHDNIEITDDFIEDCSKFDIYMIGTIKTNFTVDDWNRVFIIE